MNGDTDVRIMQNASNLKKTVIIYLNLFGAYPKTPIDTVYF